MKRSSIWKGIGIGILMFCVSISSFGQELVTRADLDKKRAKIYKQAVKEGRNKNYEKSLKLYEKVLKEYPTCIDAQLRKAGMLHNMKNYEASAQEFQKAIDMAPEYDPQMYYSLAFVNRDLKRFDVAAENFQYFIDRSKEEKKKERARKLRDQSLFMHKAYANPVPFKPIYLEGGINTKYQEYVPKMNIEGTQMIFTRRINQDEDFYEAIFEDGEVVEVRAIDGLNSPISEGVHTISADGRVLIFTMCENRLTGLGSCDLYYSYLEDDGWSLPSNMGKVINSISSDRQPSLSTDGKKLFFSSRRQGGYGGSDLYLSTRTDTSGWTYPKLLPDVINTPGNEESPFIHPDGHTLYFRSDYHTGMGSFDIFYSRYVDSTDTWSIPENLGYPINTEGDEGALSVSLDGKKAYYTSDKAYLDDRSNANLDIYSFDLYEAARPMPSTFVKARIRDAVTDMPLIATYAIEPLKKTIKPLTGVSDTRGTMITSLPTNMDYAFFVEKEGYLLYSGSFRLEGIQDVSDPFILDIRLNPIPETKDSQKMEVSEPIILNNIFFESGLAILKKESDIEISRLSEHLKKNQGVSIAIHGHTDNVGSESDNLTLSEQRAKAVRNALIDKGIAPERITYQGFGETQPLDTNETEEGRRNNRRTEFVVN